MTHRRHHAGYLSSLLTVCALLPPAAACRAGAVSWNTDFDGLWTTPANWSSNPNLPGPSDDVTINRASASPTVTLDSGTQIVHSLSIFDPLIMFAPATLDLSGGNFLISSTFTFNGGTIKNGSIGEGLGGLINISGGTLDNVTVNTDLALTNATLKIFTALPIGGFNIDLDSEGINSSLNFTGNVRVFAVGNILFDGIGTGSLAGSGTITLDPNMTVRTSTGNGRISVAACINQGTLFADTSLAITITSPSFVSSGTITGPGSFTFSGSGNLISGVYSVAGLTLFPGNLEFQTPAGSAAIISGAGALTVDAGSALTCDALVAGSLSVNGALTLRKGPSVTSSKTSSLAIAHLGPIYTGKLDLTANKLVLQATSPADKQNRLAALLPALVAGKTALVGITSSTAAADPTHYAVGLFDNALLALSTFGGQSVDANSLLISIAHLGDANITGLVDIQDQSLITNHWQSAQTNWAAGDLNLDGFVDLQDLTLVTNNWQQSSSLGIQHSAFGISSVPEPASLALLLPALALLTRRRANQ